MKIYKNNKKRSFFAGVLLAFCVVCTSSASAEVLIRGKERPEVDKKPLIPNISVTFNLNSALDERDTAYYSAIVEELLRNIPRRVELYGEERELLNPSKNLDHMKVIAYLPTSKEAGLGGDKELRYFDVEFFAPEKRARVNEVDGFSSADMGKAIVVRKERYEDFLKKVSNMKEGEASPLLNVNDAFSKMEANPKLGDAVTAADLTPVQSPDMKMANIGENASNLAEKGSDMANIGASSTEKEHLLASNGAKSPLLSPSHKQKTGKVELAYFGDEITFGESDKTKLERFIAGKETAGVKRIRIISQALASGSSSASAIAQKRADTVKGLLKEKGFDTSRAKVSEIVVQAPFFQALSVEIVY